MNEVRTEEKSIKRSSELHNLTSNSQYEDELKERWREYVWILKERKSSVVD